MTPERSRIAFPFAGEARDFLARVAKSGEAERIALYKQTAGDPPLLRRVAGQGAVEILTALRHEANESARRSLAECEG